MFLRRSGRLALYVSWRCPHHTPHNQLACKRQRWWSRRQGSHFVLPPGRWRECGRLFVAWASARRVCSTSVQWLYLHQGGRSTCALHALVAACSSVVHLCSAALGGWNGTQSRMGRRAMRSGCKSNRARLGPSSFFALYGCCFSLLCTPGGCLPQPMQMTIGMGPPPTPPHLTTPCAPHGQLREPRLLTGRTRAVPLPGGLAACWSCGLPQHACRQADWGGGGTPLQGRLGLQSLIRKSYEVVIFDPRG